jgi:hypothetical protein
MDSFKQRVYDHIVKGKTFRQLGLEDRVALSAQRIKGLHPAFQHEFFTDSEGSDELMKRLLDYLCAWNTSNANREFRRSMFEQKLIEIIVDYGADEIEQEFLDLERENEKEEKQRWA